MLLAETTVVSCLNAYDVKADLLRLVEQMLDGFELDYQDVRFVLTATLRREDKWVRPVEEDD